MPVPSSLVRFGMRLRDMDGEGCSGYGPGIQVQARKRSSDLSRMRSVAKSRRGKKTRGARVAASSMDGRGKKKKGESECQSAARPRRLLARRHWTDWLPPPTRRALDSKYDTAHAPARIRAQTRTSCSSDDACAHAAPCART